MMSDPSRLIDDPSMSSSLRADLAQAKAASLEGFAVGTGAVQLEAAIAAEATAAGASAAAAAGVSKGLVAALVGVTAAGAIALWATRGDGPKVGRTDAMTVPASPYEESPRSSGSVADPDEAPAAGLVPEPAAEPVPEPAAEPVPEPASEPEPAPLAESTSAEPPASPAAKPHRPRKASGDDELREARLIADARRAMETDPARAQRLLRKAKRAFPDGLLREEREALSILVHAKLGSTEKAAAAAKRFLSEHEHSPYADAVRRAVQ